MKEQSRSGGKISEQSSQDYRYWSAVDPLNRLGQKAAALKKKSLGLCLQNPRSGGVEKNEKRRARWHKITIS